MNAISAFYLHAKHWQVFLLIFGLAFVVEIGSMFFVATGAANASPEKLFTEFGLVIGLATLLAMLALLAWLWSLGSFLVSIVRPDLRLKTRFFKFALVYPALYIFVFVAAFTNVNSPWIALIFPFHFFAMYCMFYCLYFVSKSLAQAENERKVSFYDYAGPFFLIWFFPIGVWIIQPRINRLFAARRETA